MSLVGKRKTDFYLVKIVVEIYVCCTQVSPEQCGMGSKDCGNRKFPKSSEDYTNPCLPFMKVSNYVRLVINLTGDLKTIKKNM